MLFTAGCGSKEVVTDNTPSPAPTESVTKPQQGETSEKSDGKTTGTEQQTPEVTDVPDLIAAPDVTATPAPEATTAPEVTTAPEETKTPTATATPVPDKEPDDAIVQMFFPLYASETAPTDEEMAKLVKENNWDSYKITEDGVYVYLTKAQKKAYIGAYREELKKELANFADESDFEDIDSITVSDDFTKYKIVTCVDELDETGLLALFSVAAIAYMDSSMSGEPITGEASLIFKDSGELIYSVDFTGKSYEDIVNQISNDALAVIIGESGGTSEEEIFKAPEINSVKYNKDGETVLLDNENVVVTLTSIMSDWMGDISLGITIENKLDASLAYSTDYIAINDYVTDGYLLTPTLEKYDVYASEIILDEFGPYSPDSMSKIQIGFLGYDANTYETAFRDKFELVFDGEEISYDHELQAGEKVVLDNRYVKIIAGAPEYDELYYSIPVYVYNKTGIDLEVGEEKTVIDEFMCDCSFFETVPACTWLKSEFMWSRDDFSKRSIGYPASIDMRLAIGIDETMEELSVDYISLDAGNLSTGKTPYTLPGDATVLYDGEDFTIAVLGNEYTDSYFGFTSKLYINNKTDKNVEFFMRKSILDGADVSGIAYIEVYAGCKTIDGVYWIKDSLQGSGISSVSDVTLTLYAVDVDKLGAKNVFEKTFNYKVK